MGRLWDYLVRLQVICELVMSWNLLVVRNYGENMINQMSSNF